MTGDLQNPVLAGNEITSKSGRVLAELEDFFRRAVKRPFAGILQHVAGGDQHVDLVDEFGRRAAVVQHRIGDESFVVLVCLICLLRLCALLDNGGEIAHTVEALAHGVGLASLTLRADEGFRGEDAGLDRGMLQRLREGLKQRRWLPVSKLMMGRDGPHRGWTKELAGPRTNGMLGRRGWRLA